jgi:hypothetical protein
MKTAFGNFAPFIRRVAHAIARATLPAGIALIAILGLSACGDENHYHLYGRTTDQYGNPIESTRTDRTDRTDTTSVTNNRYDIRNDYSDYEDRRSFVNGGDRNLVSRWSGEWPTRYRGSAVYVQRNYVRVRTPVIIRSPVVCPPRRYVAPVCTTVRHYPPRRVATHPVHGYRPY